MKAADNSGISSVLNKKKNIQKSERHRWQMLKEDVKERVELEKLVLNNRKIQKDYEK